jgi:hypothetical protein
MATWQAQLLLIGYGFSCREHVYTANTSGPTHIAGAPCWEDANVTTNLALTKYYPTLVNGPLRATVDRHLKP